MTGRQLDGELGDLLRFVLEADDLNALVEPPEPGHHTTVDGRFDLAAVARRFLERLPTLGLPAPLDRTSDNRA
jgi:hypothetical protein